ncbi:uncharacterized protein LOC144420872 [Styela clava]
MKYIFFGLLLVAMVMASLSESSVKKTQRGKAPKKLSWRLWWRVFKLTKRGIDYARRNRRRTPFRICIPGRYPYHYTRCPPPPFVKPYPSITGSRGDEEIQYNDQNGADMAESQDEDVFDFLEAMDEMDQQN